MTIKDKNEIAMAGIYQISKDGEMQCCLITMQANKNLNKIYHRMPVIIDESSLKRWIETENSEEIDSIIQRGSEIDLVLFKVSDYVNNAKNEGPQCVKKSEYLRKM